MSDEAVAQARRLHHHVMNGGSVTALDMSRLVQAMEQMQAERNDLAHEQIASTEWQTRYQRAKAQRDEARVERDRLREALEKIGGITMSMCLNYKDMAETQRDIARAALEESAS